MLELGSHDGGKQAGDKGDPILDEAVEQLQGLLRGQDRQDAANLYQTLTEQVIPEVYNRDANGVPRAWIKRIRRALVTLVPQYNTWRMVQEYTQKYYLTK